MYLLTHLFSDCLSPPLAHLKQNLSPMRTRAFRCCHCSDIPSSWNRQVLASYLVNEQMNGRTIKTGLREYNKANQEHIHFALAKKWGLGRWIRKMRISNSWKFHSGLNEQTQTTNNIRALWKQNCESVLGKCDNEVQNIPMKVGEQFPIWTRKYKCDNNDFKGRLWLTICQFSVCLFYLFMYLFIRTGRF